MKHNSTIIRLLSLMVVVVLPLFAHAQSESVGVRLLTEYEEMPLYPGMTIEYTVRLLMDPQVEVQSYQLQEEPAVDGCTIDLSPNVPEKVLPYIDDEGREWLSVVIDRLYITPNHSGGFTIPGLSYDVSGIRSMQTAFPDRLPVLDNFSTVLRTSPLYFMAMALPADAPDGFAGVIGEFKYFSGCNCTEATVGNLVTVTCTVSGVGNPAEVQLPPLMCTGRSIPCEVSEPYRTCREQKAGNQMMGVVRYTYTVKPLQPGLLEMQTPQFVYLNQERGEYETIDGDTLVVDVR